MRRIVSSLVRAALGSLVGPERRSRQSRCARRNRFAKYVEESTVEEVQRQRAQPRAAQRQPPGL